MGNLDEIIEPPERKRINGERPYLPIREKDDDILRTTKGYKGHERSEDEILENMLRANAEPEIDTKGVQIYDVDEDMREDFQCINLHIKPLTPICVFAPEEDVYISGTITRGDVWEQHIVRKFQNVLQLHPDTCVIDLGANIGQYSLIAANMGHKVLAVEPYLPSLKRFHKAILKGNLTSKIKVLQNAVSDKREFVNIKANVDNQGDARIYPMSYDLCMGQSCQGVKAIHMNDLIPYIQSKECILKLDIQGFEHRAFVHAQLLLGKISIPYIFMEWSMMRDYYITETHESEDKALVNNMISLLVDNGYFVFSLVSGRKLNVKYWHGWAEDVLWILKSGNLEIINE